VSVYEAPKSICAIGNPESLILLYLFIYHILDWPDLLAY